VAEAETAPQAATSQQARPTALFERYQLARLVVVGSFLTLFLLVGTLIALSQSSNTASETAKNAFTAILPVLAGWVGTVLAFYFSAASAERTSDSLDKVIDRSVATSGSSTLVSEKMIQRAKIVGLQDLKEKGGAEKIAITDLKSAFDASLPNGGKVTRLLFIEGDVFRYVLHVGTFNAFLVKNPSATTFAQMLADVETLHQISRLVVVVAASATLADAKAALDKVTGAQDIIVTASGSATEPMLGWLSNVDLMKALQAK
jgi:hypothetical protein